jgi:isopenicillin N synthase-like dioxygenase
MVQGYRDEVVTTIDLKNSEKECAELMREAALKGDGFFYVTGHGIASGVMDRAMKASEDFYKQDRQTKDRFRMKNLTQSPLGYMDAINDGIIVEPEVQSQPDTREHLRVAKKRYLPDFRNSLKGTKVSTRLPEYAKEEEEDLHWFDELEASDYKGDFNVAAFKSDIEEYYHESYKLARKMHRIIALSLGLEPNFFDQYLSRPLDMLMLNRYPPVKLDASKGEVGMGAHCDFGFMTLLLSDGIPGLQICPDKTIEPLQREWITVQAQKKGTFMINFGDMLEHFTNGRYTSVLHRVVNITGQERKSLAMFVDPSGPSPIKPIQRLMKEGEVANFDPIERYAQSLAYKLELLNEKVEDENQD